MKKKSQLVSCVMRAVRSTSSSKLNFASCVCDTAVCDALIERAYGLRRAFIGVPMADIGSCLSFVALVW